MADEVDVMNRHMVGGNGDEIVILNPPHRLTRDEALVFAAWIVALADFTGEGFPPVLAAVLNT